MKLMTEESFTIGQVYRAGRKDISNDSILHYLGFFGFAGLHRFTFRADWLGILYILRGDFVSLVRLSICQLPKACL